MKVGIIKKELNMNIVEVNGIKYTQKEQPKKRLNPMIMGMIYGGLNFINKERPKVDIVKEYGLIQEKKSNLSRSNRDWVVSQFEKNFTKL